MSQLRASAPRRKAGIDVLVVDDSSVVRALICSWLAGLDWVGEVTSASDGLTALASVAKRAPDVIVLDLEMPGIDGLRLIPQFQRLARTMAIIVCSSLARNGAALAIECLDRGAADIIGKPTSASSDWTVSAFRQDLLERVKALGERESAPALRASSPALARPPRRLSPAAILIGASTGGPHALQSFLPAIAPLVERIPVIIAQHVPVKFSSVFAAYFQAQLDLPFALIREGSALGANCIHVIPGDCNLTVTAGLAGPVARLTHCREKGVSTPSVDRLFESAAQFWGVGAVAVVLSGMGDDGLRGARAITAAGGAVYAQDHATSVVWGMPGAVAQAGLASAIDTPEALGRRIAGLGRGGKS